MLLAGGAILCTIRWQAWFGNPAEPEWTSDTIAYHFSTFGQDYVPGFCSTPDGWTENDADSDTLRILLLGDVHNVLTRHDYETLAALWPDMDAIAQLGDWMERGYFYYEQQLIHELHATIYDSLPVLSCPGNHEYRKGIVRRLPASWKQLFPQPTNGPIAFEGTTYYVDFPRLRFIVIDTNGLQILHHYTRVQTWLAKALRTANGRFTVVMMHHPVYSCGKGRQNIGIRTFFGSTLAKADLVFAGHDHNYMRRLPFVNTNATTKAHRPHFLKDAEAMLPNEQVYELLSLYGDTLRMQTYRLHPDSASQPLVDEVIITKNGSR